MEASYETFSYMGNGNSPWPITAELKAPALTDADRAAIIALVQRITRRVNSQQED